MKCLVRKIFLLGILFIFALISFWITNLQAYPNNNPRPELTAYMMSASSSSLTSADFNGDAREDLATVHKKHGCISILPGNGDGTFGEAVHLEIDGTPHFLVANDFNEDMKMDLAAAIEKKNEITGAEMGYVCILLGHGDGTFEDPMYTEVGGEPSFLTSADFDMDGIKDLALTTEEETEGQEANYLCLLLGCGEGAFKKTIYMKLHGEATSLVATDFNMDNMNDLAIAVEEEDDDYEYADYGKSSCICLLLGLGDGTFEEPVHTMLDYGLCSMISGDFNMDSIPDLAAIEKGSGNICVLMGSPDGIFEKPICIIMDNKAHRLISDDFNGDGIEDFATTDKKGGKVCVLLGKGDGTFEEAVYYTVEDTPSAIVSADFNGDRKKDLALVVDKKMGKIVILIGQGDGSFILM